MEQRDWLKLQNGSDIRGVACEGVAGEEVNLTPEIAACIGAAFVRRVASFLHKDTAGLRIAAGRDSRITGEALLNAFAKGVTAAGATVIDCGMASTPAMFMATVYDEIRADASCMLTASHLPFNRNGMKFFTKEGGYDKQDITALLTDAASEDVAALLNNDNHPEKPESFDLIGLYAGKLSEIIRKEADAPDYDRPLKGLKIVVDAGNGGGGFFATKVLDVLGADTAGSLYLEPDGMFPNHAPNPEDASAMRAICDATVRNGADLGLIFDTDVDRMSAVLPDGRPVNRDAIIALMAAILAPDYPHSTIITDSVTSDRLTDFLEGHLGLKHLRYMRGYKNVINKCRELNAVGTVSPLAMETSGHGCLKENYYLDDGAYLAVKLLIALSVSHEKNRQIGDLISALSDRYSAREIRLKITEEDFAAFGERVIEAFTDRMKEKGFALPESYEGVRVRFDKGSVSGDFAGGWAVLRASLHDPVMVLNMEGTNDSDLHAISQVISEALAPEGLSFRL